MVSAVEAEVGALFYNGQEVEPILVTLHKIGHKQPTTPMITKNSAVNAIANNIVRQKKSKSVDVLFYWIQD